MILQEQEPFVRKLFPGEVRHVISGANDLPFFILVPFFVTILDVDATPSFVGKRAGPEYGAEVV